MKKTIQDNKQLNNHRPSKCACTNVRRASRAITKFYDMAMVPSGLKITQFAMLRNIMVSGPLSASELAQILKLDRTTLVRNLKFLEADNYIESVNGADARMRPIAITRKGHSAIETALPYWEKAQATIKSRLGAEGLDKFISVLMDIEALAE
jgi:DNA-binding MarR family transcriptional regulator